jgi:hypothetical protein
MSTGRGTRTVPISDSTIALIARLNLNSATGKELYHLCLSLSSGERRELLGRYRGVQLVEGALRVEALFGNVHGNRDDLQSMLDNLTASDVSATSMPVGDGCFALRSELLAERAV